MKLTMKEELSSRGMAAELAEVLTCKDTEDLKHKLDILQRVYGKQNKPQEIRFKGGKPVEGMYGLPSAADPVRRAMGLE